MKKRLGTYLSKVKNDIKLNLREMYEGTRTRSKDMCGVTGGFRVSE